MRKVVTYLVMVNDRQFSLSIEKRNGWHKVPTSDYEKSYCLYDVKCSGYADLTFDSMKELDDWIEAAMENFS